MSSALGIAKGIASTLPIIGDIAQGVGSIFEAFSKKKNNTTTDTPTSPETDSKTDKFNEQSSYNFNQGGALFNNSTSLASSGMVMGQSGLKWFNSKPITSTNNSIYSSPTVGAKGMSDNSTPPPSNVTWNNNNNNNNNNNTTTGPSNNTNTSWNNNTIPSAPDDFPSNGKVTPPPYPSEYDNDDNWNNNTIPDNKQNEKYDENNVFPNPKTVDVNEYWKQVSESMGYKDNGLWDDFPSNEEQYPNQGNDEWNNSPISQEFKNSVPSYFDDGESKFKEDRSIPEQKMEEKALNTLLDAIAKNPAIYDDIKEKNVKNVNLDKFRNSIQTLMR